MGWIDLYLEEGRLKSKIKRPLQNSPKSPKFPSRHLGDLGEFCNGLNLRILRSIN